MKGIHEQLDIGLCFFGNKEQRLTITLKHTEKSNFVLLRLHSRTKLILRKQKMETSREMFDFLKKNNFIKKKKRNS